MAEPFDIAKYIKGSAEAEIGIEATRRAENCMIDIKNALKRYKCIIDPIVQISSSEGVKVSFAVVPIVERPAG